MGATSTAGTTATREEYVRLELERLFREWALRSAPIGAAIFVAMAPLDTISAPELAPTFLGYRLAACAGLLAVRWLAARTSSGTTLRAVILAALALAAGTIEAMILKTGGQGSPYHDGMILLAVTVLGLIPASAGFQVLAAALIYAVNLVPLALLGAGAGSRVFFTQNYLLVSIFAMTIAVRQLHRKLLIDRISLAFDLTAKEKTLEAEVAERTGKLERAAAEWRATFDTVSDRIVMIDPEGNIIRANVATREFARQDMRDLIGIPVSALLHRAGLEGALPALSQQRRTGARATTELRHYHSGRWFLATAEPIPEGLARAGGSVLTLRDITDLKLMERAVAEARDDWEETFNSIREGITIHDAKFVVLRANAAARRILGIDDAPLQGRSCHELFHGTKAPIGGCPACESLRTGSPTTVDLYEPALGRYLEVATLPRSGGGITHVVHDISERKQAMDELSDAAARLLGILERAPFGVFIVNQEFRVEFANGAMIAISGFPREQFVGAFLGGFPGCTELGLAPLVQQALEGAPFRLGPAAYHCHAGKKVVGQFTGIPVEERGEHKALVFVEDVTTLTAAEEQRRHLNELLLQAQKMESIGTLASGIAHDFNNILLAVIGMTDAAAERLGADHMVRPDLEAVIGAAERGSELVQQLMAFSRKQDLNVRAVDLRRLVEEMRSMLVHVFPKTIAIVSSVAEPLPPVLADAAQLGQVVMNLAVNARDAMPEGGTLTMDATAVSVPEPDQRHPGVAPGSYVLLRVGDTGIGMSPEVSARIFDPFFTTKGPGKGTGLGLATVYGIVTQHGGAIRVESAPGQGATFFVYLPAAPGAVLPAGRPAPRGVETILLVDNDDLARTVVARSLADLGYRIVEAGDGEQALQLLDREGLRPDALLCDTVPGVVSAREIAGVVRARVPGVVAVFISAHPESQLAQHGLLENGDLLLSRSLDGAELARRLRDALDRRVVE